MLQTPMCASYVPCQAVSRVGAGTARVKCAVAGVAEIVADDVCYAGDVGRRCAAWSPRPEAMYQVEGIVALALLHQAYDPSHQMLRQSLQAGAGSIPVFQ